MSIAPSDNAQRKAVIVLVKVIAVTILTAVATWRLGLLIGIEPKILDDLLLLGLPLVGFFFSGIFCLAIVAWLVGVLPTLVILRLNLKGKRAAVFVSVLTAMAIVISWAMQPEGFFLLVVAYVAAIIGLTVVSWRVSLFLWPRRFELLAWEAGVVSIAMLLVLSRTFVPTRDLPILLFSAVFVRIASLFTPRLTPAITNGSNREKRWLYWAAAHGATISFLLPFTWFA